MTLAVGRLLEGQLVPRIVELDGASLELERGRDAALRLNLAVGADAGAGAPSGAGLLRDLVRPPGESEALPFLSQLRRIRLRDAQVTLRDAALGLTWQATAPVIDMERERHGGVKGEGQLVLSMGPARATFLVKASLSGKGTEFSVSTSEFSPASLAGVAPAFAALAALDAPVR
ncbi:MAG: hypothetical protein WDN04_17920, partial [Rhodospirillales bacterium]